MFSFIYKAISFCLGKPALTNFPPKGMSIFFRDSLAPKFMFVNLQDMQTISFEIKTGKGIGSEINSDYGDNIYKLVMVKNNSERIELADFSSREKANEAMTVLKVKFFGTEKTLFKLGALVLFLAVVFGVLMDIVSLQVSRFGTQETNEQLVLPQLQQHGGLSQDQINALLANIQQQPEPQQPPTPAANEEPMTPGDAFLRRLQN